MLSLTLPIAFLWTLLAATCLTHYLGSKAINRVDDCGSKNAFLRFSAALFTCFVLQIAVEIWIHVVFDCTKDQFRSAHWPFELNAVGIIFKIFLDLIDVIRFPALLLAAGVSLTIALRM